MNKICCGKSKIKKRAVSVLLSLSMSMASLAGYQFSQKVNAAQDVMLHNPVIVEDSAMEAGQKVTWDCVWFGNYPQTEVKETDSEYASLQSAGGWDSNGDIVVNGTKYRRMLKGDATYATSGSSYYYDWEDDTTYHYFRYEPVKWRVLKTDGSNAILLSDIVLDDRKYNTEWKDTTWETSTIRSWLNGYTGDVNQEGIDYSSSNFMDSAFTDGEQSAIKNTNVVNSDNLYYGTEGGNDTIDKLFLLSESEVYTDNAATYGFVSNSGTDDEARRCKSSDYAKAMGVYSSTSTDYKGKCWWWLRSPGDDSRNAAGVNIRGYIDYYGYNVNYYDNGVRVALNLNLSSSNLYTYAGTVCSDGTVNEQNAPITGWEDNTNSITSAYKYDFSDILFSLYSRKAFAKGNISTFKSGSAKWKISGAEVETAGVTHSVDGNEVKLSGTSIGDRGNYAVFKKDGYRDYIIPSEVAKSWAGGAKRRLNVYMSDDTKDGKPYVSTVFACEKSGVYEEVQSQTLKVAENKLYDIIITASGAGEGTVYYLEQDASHKIQSDNGIFTAQELYNVFSKNKDLYAYLKTADGTISEQVKVKFEKMETGNAVKDFMQSSTFSLIGTGGQKISISDDVPLVGGSEIGVNAVKFPIGFEVTGDKVKISFGLDIFDKTNNNGKKEFEWGDFKKQCSALQSAIKKADKKINTFNNFKKYFGSGSFSNEGTSLGMDVLGYAEARITDNELVFTDVCGSVAAEFAYQYTQQGLIWGVPAYFYVKAGMDASLSFNKARLTADKEVPLDFGLDLKINPYLQLGGGAGIKGAVSAGIYGKGSLPFEIDFAKKYRKLQLKGEIGVEGEFFVLKGKVPLLDGTINIMDEYYGNSLSKASHYEFAGFNESSLSIVPRDYLDTTSEWNGEIAEDNAEKGIDVTKLQESVYANGQCRMAAFDDKMLMVWIEDCKERDTYNRMRLVYSVYNNDEQKWSIPKAVYDSGNLDNAPAIASDGKNVYVVWQNVNEKLNSADSKAFDTIIKHSEIMSARYDAENDCFTDVTALTDNNTYDYAPQITIDSGKAAVYWANSTSGSFEKGTLSVMKKVLGEIEKPLYTNLNYIAGISAAAGHVAYSMDADGDLQTVNDVYVYEDGNKVSEDNRNSLNFTYGNINGRETLFYADNTNLYCMAGGEPQKVFEEDRSISDNLEVINNGNVTTVIWSELTEEGSEFYTCSYENGIWNAPVQLSHMKAQVSGLDAVYYNNHIWGIFDCTSRNKVQDLEGEFHYESGLTDMCQFVTNGFTDLGVYIPYVDESLFVKGKNTPVTVILENKGTDTINNVRFQISDSQGTVKEVKKAVNLPQGAMSEVKIDYTVPEELLYTVLTITALPETGNDADTSDNTASYNIGSCDISINNLKAEEVGNIYIINGTVMNENAAAAKNVIVDVLCGAEDTDSIQTIAIGDMEAGEAYEFQYMFDKSDAEFDKDGNYIIYFKATTDSKENIDGNNKSAVVITKEKPKETDSEEETTKENESEDVTTKEPDSGESTSTEEPTTEEPATKEPEVQVTDLSAATIRLSDDIKTYNGSEQKVNVLSVTLGKVVLKPGIDYEVKDITAKDAGKYTVLVYGIGNYIGQACVDFTITPKSLKDINVNLSVPSSVVYKGTGIYATVTAADGSYSLQKDTDYKLSYKNNNKIGKATVTIKGTGNYIGSKNKSFKIVPDKPVIRKVSGIKGKKLKVYFNKVKGAQSYDLYYRIKGTSKWKSVKSKKNTIVISGLKKNKTYQIRVRSCAKSGGKIYTGKYSRTVSVKVKK